MFDLKLPVSHNDLFFMLTGIQCTEIFISTRPAMTKTDKKDENQSDPSIRQNVEMMNLQNMVYRREKYTDQAMEINP